MSKLSFYDWCIKYNKLDMLNLRDNELNAKSPKDISHATHDCYYFKCPRGIHESQLYIISYLTRYTYNEIKCSKCNSFGQWCLDNNRRNILDRWDYKLNNVNPFDVPHSSTKSYYFTCQNGIHESEMHRIECITNKNLQDITCSKCNSFGQWCIDNNQQELLDRWDYELNKIGPFDVSRTTKVNYYFKCPNHNPLHKSEAKSLANLINQPGSRRCIACESFAQWGIDNICEDFLEKYWSAKNTIDPFTITYGSTKKIWIKCQQNKHHGDYESSPNNFTSGKRCPYCAGIKVNYFDSLGYNYPLAVERWSDKNAKSPYDYMCGSGEKVWFVCPIHGEYKTRVYEFTRNDGICPKCSIENGISKIQRKVQDYLTDYYHYELKHEYDCSIIPINPLTNSRLPFDIEVIDLRLIIEVHGKQHYEATSLTKMIVERTGRSMQEELEYQKWKDKYKKEYAMSNGYNYLEIPYYTDNKSEDYKKLIDNKISEIINKFNINSNDRG